LKNTDIKNPVPATDSSTATLLQLAHNNKLFLYLITY
jgi:hypothetical protein